MRERGWWVGELTFRETEKVAVDLPLSRLIFAANKRSIDFRCKRIIRNRSRRVTTLRDSTNLSFNETECKHVKKCTEMQMHQLRLYNHRIIQSPSTTNP